MKKEKSKYIKRIFDKVTSNYENNNEIIFSHDNERKKLIYTTLHKRFNDWKKNHKCIFYGCNKDSIIHSHTISKSSNLEIIAEKRHVFKPMINTNNGELKMGRVGINEASTFPGFCEEHESLFEEYEQNKELEKNKHFTLQIYRTVCREFFVKKFYLEQLKEIKNKYINFRNEKIKYLFKKEFEEKFLRDNKVKIKEIDTLNYDYKEIKMNKKIKNMKKDLKKFKANFYNPISHSVINKQYDKLSYISLAIDKTFPVALAGLGNFIMKIRESDFKNITAILNILPYEDKTWIIIATNKKHAQYISGYLTLFDININKNGNLKNINNCRLINMIETWMVYGTDHWFIKPSIWNKISTIKQDRILKDIWDLNKNISQEYKNTIFKEIKMTNK